MTNIQTRRVAALSLRRLRTLRTGGDGDTIRVSPLLALSARGVAIIAWKRATDGVSPRRADGGREGPVTSASTATVNAATARVLECTAFRGGAAGRVRKICAA